MKLIGTIYEEKNMINKALLFMLTAAFLSSKAEEWERLAEFCLNKTVSYSYFLLGESDGGGYAWYTQWLNLM